MGERVSNACVRIAEIAASAALAGACAFAVARLLPANGISGGVLAAAVVAGGLVFLLSNAVLARVARTASRSVAPFQLEPIPPVEAEDLQFLELLLSDVDRLRPDAAGGTGDADGQELLLDDILAELRPDARVVRLFDVNAMPTPGELQSSIDRHLNSSGSRSAPPDASDALHQALAELRRSLR